MAEFVKVCGVDDVPVGEARQFGVNGRQVAVARVSFREWHAIGGICPHEGYELGSGRLEGRRLTCPHGGFQFDVTTGRLVCWVQDWDSAWKRALSGLVPGFMRRNVPSYAVRVEDGRVLVKVDA